MSRYQSWKRVVKINSHGKHINFNEEFFTLSMTKWGLVMQLTHWGRVTHICVGKLTIIGSDNGFSPGRRQAIIRTNAGISLIRTLGANVSEIFSKINTFSFKKKYLKMSSGKWRPFCLCLNVLNSIILGLHEACHQFVLKPLLGPFLSIGHLRATFNEISVKIFINPFMKTHLKMLSAKYAPFHTGLMWKMFRTSLVHHIFYYLMLTPLNSSHGQNKNISNTYFLNAFHEQN